MGVDAPSAEALLALARDRSAERRNLLSLTLVDLFRDGNAALTDRERAIMTDILRRLVGEMEVEVRRTIAHRLADSPTLPRSLARDLANDEIEVAWPILRRSRVLEDLDLIEVIHHRSLEHRLVIAQRGVISESVADALIRRDEENVIVTLLNNPDARLSQAAMDYLAEQSRRVDTFQEPLLHRAELTADLAVRMFTWVSAALRDHIIERFQLDPAAVDQLVESSLAGLSAETAGEARDRPLIREMDHAGMVSPALMLRALAAGQVQLYAGIVEKLTGIRPRLALRLLFEAAGEGLAVQCRALDLPKPDFLELYTIARKARPADPEQVSRDVERLDQFYSTITSDAARAVVLRWRRNPDYLAALRAIDMVTHV
ncbi:MAG: DUF2336 domain-containing protein [Telmatospirillum sp.]|nr:DUF2336 domain-containing protein [Telmatospirillum sp.]